MNVDAQGSNPESRSYGHNDDIHIQGNLSPNDSGKRLRIFIITKQMLVAAMIIIY